MLYYLLIEFFIHILLYIKKKDRLFLVSQSHLSWQWYSQEQLRESESPLFPWIRDSNEGPETTITAGVTRRSDDCTYVRLTSKTLSIQVIN